MKSEDEWRRILSPISFNILRKKGTEPPFHNEYWDNERHGKYLCAGCSQPLFASEQKFDSGTGWPSFWAPISKDAVETAPEDRYGSTVMEVMCSNCGGHLGHVFNDGPPPTGLRYCMNSGAMKFKEE